MPGPILSLDGAHPSRIHVPLQLAIEWTAEYIGSGTGPIEGDPTFFPTDIDLTGGYGPSFNNLGGLPSMGSVPQSRPGDEEGDPPQFDHAETDAYKVTFNFTKHRIPVKIVYRRTETDQDNRTLITEDFILMSANNPNPDRTFSASGVGTLTQAFVCSVEFIEVYAPWLG